MCCFKPRSRKATAYEGRGGRAVTQVCIGSVAKPLSSRLRKNRLRQAIRGQCASGLQHTRREGGATTDAPPRGGRPPRSPARIPEQAANDGETTPPPSRGRRRGRRKPRADESPATPSTPAGTPTTPATPSTPADSPRAPADGTTRNHRRRRRRSGSQPET